MIRRPQRSEIGRGLRLDRPGRWFVAPGFLVRFGLLGGGLYLVSRLRDLFADTQSSSDFDYVTLQVLMYTAPLLLVLGLATGIGVLFVFATRWERR